MTRPQKVNLLGSVSPVMRAVTCALLKDRAETRAHSTGVVQRMAKADKSGFVMTRNLDEAMALAAACRKRHHAKPGKGLGRGFCSITFYGVRPSMQRNEDRRRASDRARLALRLQRSMQTRLKELRDETAIPAAKAVMKHGAPGGTRFIVTVGAEAEYRVVTEKVWARVNAGKDTWASLSDDHFITVTPRWTAAVRKLGTATVDRFFILDAVPFVEAPGRSVWTACLARTGRGYQAVTEQAFLSVYGEAITVHGTLQRALNAKPPAHPEQAERPVPAEDLAAIDVAFA